MASLSSLGRLDPVLGKVIWPPGLGGHKPVIVSYYMAEGADAWPSSSGHDSFETLGCKTYDLFDRTQPSV